MHGMLKSPLMWLMVAGAIAGGCSSGQMMKPSDFEQLSPSVRWVRTPGSRPGYLWLLMLPMSIRNHFDSFTIGEGYVNITERCATGEGASAYSTRAVSRTVSLADCHLMSDKPPGRIGGIDCRSASDAVEQRLDEQLTLELDQQSRQLFLRSQGSRLRLAQFKPASPLPWIHHCVFATASSGELVLMFDEYVFCVGNQR